MAGLGLELELIVGLGLRFKVSNLCWRATHAPVMVNLDKHLNN